MAKTQKGNWVKDLKILHFKQMLFHNSFFSMNTLKEKLLCVLFLGNQ